MNTAMLVVVALALLALMSGVLVVYAEARSVRFALDHFAGLVGQANGSAQRARAQAEGARVEAQSARSEAIVTRSEIQAVREMLHEIRDEMCGPPATRPRPSAEPRKLVSNQAAAGGAE